MSSASISSLASDVSRVLKLLSSNPALAVSAKADDEDGRLEADIARASSAGSAIVKAKFDPLDLLQRPPRTEIEWCCDFLPGIEAAFSASGLICLYCGDEFDQASTDWSFKGRHLVDEHRYGECNLLLSYDSEEEFTKHIREFHQCSLGYNGRLSNEFLNEHRQCGREWGFHRGPESKDQNLTNDFHNISSRRWKALSDNSKGLKALHGNSGGAKVVLPLESANKIRLEQQPWELDLFIALSEEGCIVDGLMVASIFRPWSFLNHSGDDITRSCYSLGDGIKVSGCELVDRCHSCSKAPKVLPAYDTNKHTGLDGAGLLPKSSPTAVLPKGPLDSYKIMKERNPINSWLHQILNDSSTTRIIMFHTMKKHGVNFSNMYTWLGRVLDFWDLDEAARKVHEPDNSSDGAVDSRGSPEIRGRSHNSRCNS